MFLDYFALGVTLVGITLVLYVFIFIHDIPYEMAKKNGHPHVETIHIGCWLSLFTLHALWPFLFLWAKANPQALKVQVVGVDEWAGLRTRIEQLEKQISPLTGESAVCQKDIAND